MTRTLSAPQCSKCGSSFIIDGNAWAKWITGESSSNGKITLKFDDNAWHDIPPGCQSFSCPDCGNTITIPEEWYERPHKRWQFMKWVKRLLYVSRKKSFTEGEQQIPVEFPKDNGDTSFGAKLRFRCSKCGKGAHGGTGATIIASGKNVAEAMEHVQKRVRHCPTCKAFYCTSCCFDEGKNRGVHDLVCPNCGGSVVPG